MTVIVERAVVAVVKIEAPTKQAADDAFADLMVRVGFTLPKLRFGPVTVLSKDVTVRTVSIRGAVGKAPQ